MWHPCGAVCEYAGWDGVGRAGERRIEKWREKMKISFLRIQQISVLAKFFYWSKLWTWLIVGPFLSWVDPLGEASTFQRGVLHSGNVSGCTSQRSLRMKQVPCKTLKNVGCLFSYPSVSLHFPTPSHTPKRGWSHCDGADTVPWAPNGSENLGGTSSHDQAHLSSHNRLEVSEWEEEKQNVGVKLELVAYKLTSSPPVEHEASHSLTTSFSCGFSLWLASLPPQIEFMAGWANLPSVHSGTR